MKVSRISLPDEVVDACRSPVDEEYFIGSLTQDDHELLLRDAEAFFKKAGVPIPPGARIDITMRQHPERRLATSKRGGTRPFSGVEVPSKAAISTGGGGLGEVIAICRVVVIRIDGILIVHVECIPIVVIACW